MAMTDENETKNESAPFVLGPSIFTGDGAEFADIVKARDWANGQLGTVRNFVNQIQNIADYGVLMKPYDKIMSLGTDPDEIDGSTKRLKTILKGIEKGSTFSTDSLVFKAIQQAKFSLEESAGYLSAIFNIDQFTNGALSQYLRHPTNRNGFVSGYIHAFATGLVGSSNLLPSRGLIDSALKEVDGLVSKATNQLAQTSLQIERYKLITKHCWRTPLVTPKHYLKSMTKNMRQWSLRMKKRKLGL
jgi:hypothetical protein